MKDLMVMSNMMRLQRGVALIEVVVVFFVLSVGLLGMATLQMRATQYNQSSYLRSQATTAAYDMLDRIRVNGGTVSLTDTTQWNAFLDGTFPGVAGTHGTAACAGSVCTITITWVDRTSGTVAGTDGAGNATVTVQSQL